MYDTELIGANLGCIGERHALTPLHHLCFLMFCITLPRDRIIFNWISCHMIHMYIVYYHGEHRWRSGDPGSIPRLGVIFELSLLILSCALRVFLWVLPFSSLHKNQILNCNSILGFQLDWSCALL